MAYRFELDEGVQKGLRRIAGEQIDKALAELPGPDGIHDARKRFKKIRGLLRLVRPALGDTYARENARFRDLGRDLSRLRDAEALVETFDELTQCFADQLDRKALRPMRDALVERWQTLADEEVDVDARIEATAAALREAREAAGGWCLDATGWDALGAGLKKTYARGRMAMLAAYDDPTAERFHEWRKRVKYHGYHARLLRDLWPPMAKAWRSEMKALSDLLGTDHDLAVLCAALRVEPERYGAGGGLEVLLGLAMQHSRHLRVEAALLGRRLYAEKPKHLTRRVEAWWSAAQERQSLDPRVADPAKVSQKPT